MVIADEDDDNISLQEKNGGFVRDIHTIHAGMKGMSETDKKTRWAMLKHIVLHLRSKLFT